MAKSKYYQLGFEDGKQSSYDTNWQDGEMLEAWEKDTLGEVVSEILEHWQSMASTIYQGLSNAKLDKWEEGFYAGFKAGVEEQVKEIEDSKPPEINNDDLRLDYIPDIKECRKIRAKMKADNFWPNVWHINDHGNVDLLSIGHNGAKIVKSWV